MSHAFGRSNRRLSRVAVLGIMSAFLCALTEHAVSSGAGAAPAPSSANAQLQSLAHDVTYTWAALHPIVATNEGIAGYDGKLDHPSAAESTRDLALIHAWQSKLATISVTSEPRHVRDDATLLRAQLLSMERELTVYRRDRKNYAGPGIAILDVIYTQFQYLPIADREGATHADVDAAWSAITTRLKQAPGYIRAGEALVTEPGRLQDEVGSEELAGAPEFFKGALTDAAKAQLSAAEFGQFTDARDATLREIAREKAYIDAHVGKWSENYVIGRNAYDAMLRDEFLLPYSAATIEPMATDELAHGWATSYWMRHNARLRNVALGASSGGGLAPGGAALIAYYRTQIDYLRDFVTNHKVITVPAWLGHIEVVETPKFLQPVSPGASMNPPRTFSRESIGFYYITPPVSLVAAAARLDPNEDFDRDRILSTAAHEAMPGHFLQLSIARRNPDLIRKIQESESFSEGWAYYGEEMFVALGLYGDDLDGPYDVAQWERVRGARAIVDAKLASGELSEPQAVSFFAKQTGFSTTAAKAAVDGIALDPGAVISYTVGRQQIDLLEHEYFAAMGAHGTLEDFHDRLMCYGSTPLAIVGPELLDDLSKPLSQVQQAAGAL